MRIGLLYILAFLMLCSGCHSKKHHHITPSIYYWKTIFAPTPYEKIRWQEAGIHRIYVHCFDIGVDPGTGFAAPIGIIRNLENARTEKLAPVVFITQDAIRKLDVKGVPALAANISGLLTQLFEKQSVPDEVQVDCDWTTGSRDAYFSLLRALRRTSFFQGKSLSCTIRMHQVKYRLKSGIPPVDRGLLMCYNMGDLRQPGARNSILDPRLMKDYLQDLDHYPLPLDVALPVFSWCLQFRDDRFIGILRDVPPGSVETAATIFKNEGRQLYSCKADTNWMNYTFHTGDIIRIENPDRADLLKAAEISASGLSNDSLRVIIFHSDSLSLSKHPADEIKAIFDRFP